MDNIGDKAIKATKWSLATQVISKLIQPITTLILAHILTPEIFGVIALVTMVTSFADMFSDAGFQKYLIQHEFNDYKRYDLSCNVAFWTNLGFSLALWLLISLCCNPIAKLLGNDSIGFAIVVACISLPLTSAVSVQTAVYQRKFDFKTLFYSRVGSSFLILLISVPLAIIGFGYWSMITGTIISNLFLAVWLTVFSSWKPSFMYSFSELKSMFSFSIWTLIEALSIWFTNWVGTFILGSFMSTYYLGLYNTSVSLVNAVVAIITGAVNPIVFASLSRFQNNKAKFDSVFYKMQKYLGLAVVPLSSLLFIFSDMIVDLYLGHAWLEASTFFGLYALTSAVVVVYGHVASDAYRALGKPIYSLFAQIGFLMFLIPALFAGAHKGFAFLSVLVPFARLLGSILTHSFICKYYMHLSPLKMVSGMKYIYIIALFLSVPSLVCIYLFKINYFEQIILLFIDVFLFIYAYFKCKDTHDVICDLFKRFGFSLKTKNKAQDIG